ncbi:hypothetical protein TSUD_213910 [Trifolium subterraneum]|uniref:Protein FAR1-RELATED SEQUENCE n=1 Tax=Trifolium subterraneum TaxID=3900 RepID=A0A2Z6MH92_TRISU|nr:hypothetical protein TSUD_213910 [Trifolium subterraneum]
MSTYSEATVHLESDTDEVEINSGNGMSSQQGKENSNDYKCISDLTDDDIRGMEFSTENEATKFYELYAHLHGFARVQVTVLRGQLCELVVKRNFDYVMILFIKNLEFLFSTLLTTMN